MRQKLRIRTIINFFVLIILAMGIGMIFYSYGQEASQKHTIMQSAINGLKALEQENLELAANQFDKALRQFRTYHPNPTRYQWNADAKVYALMFKVAQGYRSLGDYKNSIETYGEVAKRNIKGRKMWVAEQLFSGLSDTVESERWSDRELQEMYQFMLNIDPHTWKHGDYFQVWATELVGLRIIPMEERYSNADLIAYGLPQPMLSLKDKTLRVHAERFYRTERLPSAIEFTIPSNMNETLRKRLQWYGEAEFGCLVFGSNTSSAPVLDGIEGIVLSDHHTVGPFNELVLKHES